MNIHTISTKELREQLPRIREGLKRGEQYTVIYRSKPIARLEPIHTVANGDVRVQGGTLRLQTHSKSKLTPAYLNKLATEKYA